jgi:hypothetical protein
MLLQQCLLLRRLVVMVHCRVLAATLRGCEWLRFPRAAPPLLCCTSASCAKAATATASSSAQARYLQRRRRYIRRPCGAAGAVV